MPSRAVGDDVERGGGSGRRDSRVAGEEIEGMEFAGALPEWTGIKEVHLNLYSVCQPILIKRPNQSTQ